MDPREKLRELGIEVPRPRWKQDDYEPHPLDGSRITYRATTHKQMLETPDGEYIGYEQVEGRSEKTESSPPVGAQGAPPLKKYGGVKLLRLDERVILFRTKSDSYRPDLVKLTRVLIDLGKDPTDEEIEATAEFGRYVASRS